MITVFEEIMNTTQTAKAERSRTFLACILCKSRKRRCDGSTPKCSNCIARGVECNYAAIRKTRGPGKKKNQTEDLGEGLNTMQHLLPSTWVPDNRNISSDTRDHAIIPTRSSTERLTSQRLHDRVVAHKSIPESTTSPDSSQQVRVRHCTLQFPDFLLPGQFNTHLETFKQIMASSNPAKTFTPLMPLHISRRLIENSFTDIIAPQQLLSQSHFLSLLEAQYATSPLSPADNPARWALVNTIIALAVRFKTAPGLEAALADIMQAFYQNATRVLPELILQEPNLLSVQALLAMSLFAWNVMDMKAFVMLGTNASRLLKLLGLRRLTPDRVVDLGDMEKYEMVFRTVGMFDKSISEFLGTEAALLEEYGAYQGIAR